MQSIIEDIYLGKRGHVETIKTSAAYWKVHDEVAKQCEKLEKSMTEEQLNIFRELYITMGGLEAEQSLTHFKEGFKLGMLLAFESFT